MTVLGRKNKNDYGLPGVSRAKAIKKRKETLLQEYKVQNKSNKFKDRRIGEWDHTLTSEDKTMARFTAIRKKAHKKSIFNLADDEVLTHKGQTLAEIEKFDDPRSDNESDEDKDGNLDKDFVGDAHFGGGILRKTGKEGARTHRELIDELIAESKKRKAEKQKTKEATLELTEKLDTEWKDLLPLVSTNQKKKDEERVTTVDDYDKVMRELRFEARGTVSDRLKTEEEIAKEEKEKLEELERERQERMNGFDKSETKANHRSADDLDDDVVYEADPEYMLTYNKEGESNVEIEAEINGKKINEEKNGSEQEEDDDEDAGEEDESSPEAESEDELSDLKADSSDESEIEEVEEKPAKEQPKPESPNKLDEAETELPYTFTIPKTYDELRQLLEGESIPKQSLIIERMIKCNHPSLAAKNKENLATLFVYLLQYLNDFSSFSIFSSLAPHLYELVQLDPESTTYSIKEVIKEKHEDYKKKPKRYPETDELLIFFKLVSLLYSTSDFRHPVVTPCFVFIEQMLNKCRVKTQRDIVFGLFLVTLVLEYTTLSKRYMPAAVNFLGGILHMAIPKRGVKLIKVNAPFTPTSNLLVLTEDCTHMNDLDLKLCTKWCLEEDESDDFKLSTVYNTLELIEEFYKNWENLSSCSEIFKDIFIYLELLPTRFYPQKIRSQFELVTELLKNGRTNRTLNYIVMAAKKPKALRLYEPKIVEIFDHKRHHKSQSKEKAERDKLLHKLKKETKGALREIRRDRSFLGRVKIQDRIKSDNERRDKVKRIFSEAAIQQSELNSLDRKKKKKH